MRQEDKYIKEMFDKPVRPAAWNEPDASLWDSIESAVKPPERKRRGLGALFMWAGITSVVLIAGLYFSLINSRSEISNPQVALTESSQNNIESSAATESENTKIPLRQHTTELENKAINSARPINMQKLIKDEVTEVNTAIKVKENNHSKSTKDEAYITHVTIKNKMYEQRGTFSKESSTEHTKDIVNKSQNQFISEESPLSKSTPSTIATLNSAIDNSENRRQVILNLEPLRMPDLNYVSYNLDQRLKAQSPSIVDPIKTDNITKWAISINAGTGLWLNRPNQAMQETLEPFAFFENNAWSFTQSIQLDYALTFKWSIFAGIQHTGVRFMSGHNSGLTYSTEEETTDGHNAFKLPVATPYGTVQTEIDLRREANINGEVELDADIVTEQRIDIISIPLGVRYKIDLGRRFSFSPSLALFMNYNSSLKSKISDVYTHSNVIVFDHANTTAEPQQSSRWSQSIAPGLDLNYKINTNWGLRFNTSYLRGITPSYQSGDFQTHQDQWQINIGIIHEF